MWLVLHRAVRIYGWGCSRRFKQQGIILSATAVREILAAEGFAPLPQRLDEARLVSIGPTREALADVRAFALYANSPPGSEGCSCSCPI
jgi:hypothetical protein